MEQNAFEKAYTKLNPEQRRAVDTVEGPVMVIAGPGTGKTQLLTLRIANILKKTDTRPENILALTFTESGARTMRERLHAFIGADAYQVSIHTFHGFAEMVIRTYPDAFPRIIGGRAASDLERIHIIESILEDPSFKRLRPIGDPSYYVTPLLRMLSILKQEYIDSDELSSIIQKDREVLESMPRYHEKGAHKGKERSEYRKQKEKLEKNQELLLVYRLYEARLSSSRLYDFDDMIREVVKAFETQEDLLLTLQELYQYVLADEHQDVNGSQNRILELLSSYHPSPNLFVVGDEKQGIFRFQGASLENFLYFEDRYPGTTIISLKDNYRSRQGILDLSHSLIEVKDGPLTGLRVPLTATHSGNAVLESRRFSHEVIEHDTVVHMIEDLLTDGVSHEEIAIIVRTNKEVQPFTESLKKRGIPTRASTDIDILHHPLMRSIDDLLSLIAEPTSEEALFRVLHGMYWKIESNDLSRLFSARTYDRSLSTIMHEISLMQEIGVRKPEHIHSILDVLESVRVFEEKNAPQRAFEYLLKETGFLNYVLEEDSVEAGGFIRRIFDEIEIMVQNGEVRSLTEVYRALHARKAHKVPLLAPSIEIHTKAVSVMTAHKSKGLEFAHVFLPHLTDSLWGGKVKAQLFSVKLTRHLKDSVTDTLDDERRLLYVAMTRAKEGLYLSSSTTSIDGKEMLPSRLFDELQESLLTHIDTTEDEKRFNPVEGMELHQYSHTIDTPFLKKILLERGLSATSLNNYLKSPWNYFYRNVLRIPETQSLTLQFGTAMHAVLEAVMKRHNETGTEPSDTEVKRLLERELGRLPLSQFEFTRLHERGLTALLGYIPKSLKECPREKRTEFSVRVVLPTNDPELPEIPLTGKLDRLDFDTDGKVIRVIDYKTGRPKTRGYIEGTTKDSDGEYKRQLVFYALLLSLFDEGRYATRTGTLSFLEPDSKGVQHEETYTITDEEIDALKKEIIRVGHEIANGAFFNAPCDYSVCDYCDLLVLFRKQGMKM